MVEKRYSALVNVLIFIHGIFETDVQKRCLKGFAEAVKKNMRNLEHIPSYSGHRISTVQDAVLAKRKKIVTE